MLKTNQVLQIKTAVQTAVQRAVMIDLTGQMITTHQKVDIAGKMMLNYVKTKQERQQTMVWAVGTMIVPTVFAVL